MRSHRPIRVLGMIHNTGVNRGAPAHSHGFISYGGPKQSNKDCRMVGFDQQYRELVRTLMTEGVEEVNERTGHAVRALPGRTIEIDDVSVDFPLLTLRSIPIKIFVAEQVWFLTGSRQVTELLDEYTRIWSPFAQPNGVVAAAYGYRWRHHFHRDQIEDLVQLLERDASSRHGVVVAWDPSTDGLSSGVQRKNVPCPFAFVVNIIGGRLNLHNVVRSNDVMLGLPHDVAGYCLLQHILAERLQVKPGKYTHSISHAHIYDVHYEAAQVLANRIPKHTPIALSVPAGAYQRALMGDRRLVDELIGALAAHYRPQPGLAKLELVK